MPVSGQGLQQPMYTPPHHLYHPWQPHRFKQLSQHRLHKQLLLRQTYNRCHSLTQTWFNWQLNSLKKLPEKKKHQSSSSESSSSSEDGGDSKKQHKRRRSHKKAKKEKADDQGNEKDDDPKPLVTPPSFRKMWQESHSSIKSLELSVHDNRR